MEFMLNFESGDTDIFSFKAGTLVINEVNKMFEHEKPVLAEQSLSEHLVTVSHDKHVKIWSIHGGKKLQREIEFGDNPTAACFINESADLVVAHGSKLSLIKR